MSALKIYSIAFNANNPSGGYVAGDVVDIYYDASLDPTPGSNRYAGLTVNLNGSPITSGNDIDWLTRDYKTETGFFNGVICNQGFAMLFSPVNNSFPYGFMIPWQDHTDCSINPAVCNLIFTPNVTLTNPSSSTSNDGSITVEATSNNSIKYKLNSDFDYNDGTGVSSPVFNSLYPGSYRIYARDSINCSANILINLTVNNSYGVIYTISYKNLAGHSSKIEILKRAYAGASSEIIYGETPISLQMRNESNLDKFQSIISTQATLQLIAQTDKQFQELFTNDPKQFKVAFYKDISGGTSFELQWTGFVLPQIYQEEYTVTPYTVTVEATDSLTNLTNLVFLQDDGNKFFGTIRFLALLSIILKKTNLTLPIRCACNLFADTMAQTSSDDPFDQAFVDVETYYLATNTPTFDFVLKALLKPFRARLIQAEGRWNIVRVEEMASSFAYRDFDADGNYITNNTYDPIVNIKSATSSNRLRWSDQDQNLELRPGFGKLRILYHLGYKDNILRNGDFSIITLWNSLINAYTYQVNLYGFQLVSPNYSMGNTYELIKPNSLDDVALVLYATTTDMLIQPGNDFQPLGYIQSDDYMMAMGIGNTLKFNLNVKCPSGIYYTIAVDGDGNLVTIPFKIYPFYQKVRMRVLYGNKYLLSDGTWTNIPSDCIFYVTQFDQYVNLELTANWPDPTYSTEKQFNVRVYHSSFNDYDYNDVAALKRKITNSSVAVWSNRGNYNPSSGGFPTTGGSGGGGAILAEDRWVINVAGTIYGVTVIIGTPIRAINSSPGQDPANWLIGEVTLAVGAKTELHENSAPFGLGIYYYELKNTTAAEAHPTIVRPNDYDGALNPNQWVLSFNGVAINLRPAIEFFINKIQVEYLSNDQTPFDTIIRDVNGELNNSIAVEDEIYHGSLSSIVVNTNISAIISNLESPNRPLDFTLSGQFPNNKTIFPNVVSFPITQNIISGKLLYAGYLRDSSGIGYDTWKRVGISESDQLHSIWLKTTIAQYNRSWKKITGSLYGDVFFSFLKVLKETLEDDIIYLPASLSYDDKQNMINGEFLELIDIYANAGSDGTGVSPYNSGFSNGFSGGFN